MHVNINESDFRTRFHQMERGEQFSYEGLTALYEYLEELEEGCETKIELDVIALCCGYAEYDNLIDFKIDYDGTYGDECWCLEDIEEKTTVIRIAETKRFIIEQF